MKTLAVTIACALCAIACSPSASDDGPSIQQESGSDSGGLDEYAGKPFSEFVADHPDYLISRRAVSSEAVGLFSESDGIEVPGKLARVGNREIVIFATCGRDKCSTINNVIAVDPTNTAMHVVNHWEGKTTVVVDGPPDVASFVEERCKSVTCL